MTAHDITSAFPHPSLTPSALRPSYATLTVWQKELSGNAASVISHLGDGRQGHLALTISEAKYLAITNNVALSLLSTLRCSQNKQPAPPDHRSRRQTVCTWS